MIGPLPPLAVGFFGLGTGYYIYTVVLNFLGSQKREVAL